MTYVWMTNHQGELHMLEGTFNNPQTAMTALRSHDNINPQNWSLYKYHGENASPTFEKAGVTGVAS